MSEAYKTARLMNYEDDFIDIAPIESDSDFPFNLDNFEVVALKLSNAYRLPSMVHFNTSYLRIEGGLVDFRHLPASCTYVDISDAVVENNAGSVVLVFKSCLDLKIRFSMLCMSRQDIERTFPNAEITIVECQQTATCRSPHMSG